MLHKCTFCQKRYWTTKARNACTKGHNPLNRAVDAQRGQGFGTMSNFRQREMPLESYKMKVSSSTQAGESGFLDGVLVATALNDLLKETETETPKLERVAAASVTNSEPKEDFYRSSAPTVTSDDSYRSLGSSSLGESSLGNSSDSSWGSGSDNW